MKLTAESTVLDDKKIGDSFATLQVDADGIRAEVGRKVDSEEVISSINQSAESIQIQANKVAIEADEYVTNFGSNGVKLHPKNNDTDYVIIDPQNGMQIVKDGKIVSSHGETIILGDSNEIHFEASSNRIKFSTQSTDLCWFGLNSDGIWEMHIETTYVEKMVRYGDFAFIKRDNGNMSLKWLGE